MRMRYSHDGHGWDQQLRRAVTLIETTVLSDGLPYRESSVELDIALKAVNSSEDQKKVGGPNEI